MYDEAIACLAGARKLFPESTALMMASGHALALSGKPREARKIIAALKQIARRRYVPAFHLAAIYSALGDYDETFVWLQQARDERCDYFVYLDREPAADKLRADPRFTTLIPCAPADLTEPAP